jgi:hypothetical protein
MVTLSGRCLDPPARLRFALNCDMRPKARYGDCADCSEQCGGRADHEQVRLEAATLPFQSKRRIASGFFTRQRLERGLEDNQTTGGPRTDVHSFVAKGHQTVPGPAFASLSGSGSGPATSAAPCNGCRWPTPMLCHSVRFLGTGWGDLPHA